jgi:hypothetical protein
VRGASCHKVGEATGTSLGGLARAVHAVAMAGAGAQRGWGWRCRLDDHEPAGRASLEATQARRLEEGPQGSSGPWKVLRPDAPRHWVIGEPPEGKTWVDWGTPQGRATWEATAWPRVSRERHASQAHRGKRLSDPGALQPHSGRKKSVGRDRHQPRARAPRAPSLVAAHQRVARKAEAVQGPQAKVAEAEANGHGTRLEQRQRVVVRWAQERQDAPHTHDQRAAPAEALGPPGERADRACRQQTIRTVRTRL